MDVPVNRLTIQGCKTTKIYCRESCPPGRRMKAANRVVFGSRSDALAAGYRPCKVCKPDDPPDGRAWRPRQTDNGKTS